MHPNQKERLVQEICAMLKMPQPAVSTTLHYYRQFNDAVEECEFSNEVIVCACIYLVGKVFEEERKIRDILNTIYSAIKLYTLAAQKSDIYIDMETLDLGELEEHIKPDYHITQYNDLKRKVLDAEQNLLRILKFDFGDAETKIGELKQLLGVCDTLKIPTPITQIAINTFNDLQLTKDVVQWVPGILYFSIEVAQCLKEQEQGQNNWESINWEGLFLVPLKKLQAYSQRIILYYEQLTEQENKE